MPSDEDAQIPTPDEIIGKGIDALVALRPRALAHINAGKGGYANIFTAWRAQAALALRRLSDHALQNRVGFSTGDSLRFLAASEYDAPAVLDPTVATGQATLSRAGGRDGGVIRKGARFARPADATAQQLYAAAQYEVAVDTAVAQGATSATVPLVATREGAFANRPLVVGSTPNELTIADDIHDRAAWTVDSYEMGGGSDGVSDGDLQRYAKAFAQGQYGPTELAAVAGALRAGAKRVIVIDDPSTGTLTVYPADPSWATSTRWTKRMRQQMLDDEAIGFGCNVQVGQLTNRIVQVEATVKVTSPTHLAETSPLDTAIQVALRAYFDDRPDLNRWTDAALRGVISRADRRILACTAVAVKLPDGATVTAPTSSNTSHFMLADNGVRATYLSPT